MERIADIYIINITKTENEENDVQSLHGACCAALALSACSEEDATLHGVAPSKIGTISLNTGKDPSAPRTNP